MITEMPDIVRYNGRRWNFSYEWSNRKSSLYIYESIEEPYQAILVTHEKKVIVTFDKNGIGRFGRRRK